LTTYAFDPQLVADPVTFQRAANASITVYDVADTSNSTPLALTDMNGLPLTNPLTSTADAIIGAFQTTSPQVKLVGGGLSIPVGSFQSVLDQATAAKTFVQGIGVAATNTGAPGSNAAVAIDTNGQFTFTVPQGPIGPAGSNVLPTDTAIANAVNDTTPSATRAALDALYVKDAAEDADIAAKINDTTPSQTRGALDALYLKQADAASTYLPLSQKGANSGVASLDSSGVVAQPPMLHASRHASGGADPLHGPLNAKLDFGAKGDGTTDDTAALQSFVTYCITNQREGYIPRGTYKVTSTINFTYRPQWVIRGAGVGVTNIKMFTDNTPIFNLGSDTVSYMHSFELSNMSFNYANVQTGNTSANPILLSQMVYEGKFTDLGFDGGYYAFRVASGIGCPWGVTFDNLRFNSNLTGGAMDWSLGVNATPNNRFGRIFCSCQLMTQPVFNIRGYDFIIDTIEFIAANNGVNLMTFAAGSRVTIGALKLENGTYTTSVQLFDFQNGSTATIGHITVGGNACYFNAGTVNVVNVAPGGGYVDVGYIAFAATSNPTGAVYLGNSAASLTIGKYSASNCSGLQNNGSTTSGNFITVRDQVNGHLSDDKGDASYTVALGDPNKISYQTALTAPRTVTLPTSGTNMFNGLYYEVIVGASVATGTNTLAIMASTTTLATITTGKVIVGFTWRRHPSAPSGWILTKYETTP
jgi:hypothetical protein